MNSGDAASLKNKFILFIIYLLTYDEAKQITTYKQPEHLYGIFPSTRLLRGFTKKTKAKKNTWNKFYNGAPIE